MTTGICPVCEERTSVDLVTGDKTFEIRGENIKVPAKYYVCKNCNTEFWTPELEVDPLELAYNEYRHKHGMVQPKEIKGLRKSYGLNQKELSRLLGWGDVTIARYETGSLQDKAHDAMLKLIQDPNNMMRLLATNGDFLPENRRRSIEQQIEKYVEQQDDCIVRRDTILLNKPSKNNGFARFDRGKLFHLIHYLCWDTDGIPKTKLNKLLFYIDFLHYKLYSKSITGSCYAKLQYGPVPDNYENYLRQLITTDIGVAVREEDYGKYTGETYYSTKETDLSVFSASELETIFHVKRFFSNFNASEIMQFSHEEEGYINTPDFKLISYEYADSLKI